MAKVKAIAVGYHDHKRIYPASHPKGANGANVFEMPEVNEDGIYLDGKKKGTKCKWVDNVNSGDDRPVDVKEVAAVLSGKNPGLKAPAPEQKPAKEKK